MLAKFNQLCFTLSLIGVFLFLALIREPLFFIEPRIWAEEGAVYIQSALDNGFWSSFFSEHLGYYSLFNKLVINTSLALFPFEYIAYFTTYSSLLMIAMVIFAPVYLPSTYWNTHIKIFLLILTSMILGSAEIWVNTINVQFYLGLFTAYLLFANHNNLSRLKKIFISTILFIAATTGITSIILFPFFIWKYFVEKHKVTLTFSAILLFGSIVQLFSLYASSKSGELGARFDLTQIIHLPDGVIESLRFAAKPEMLIGVIVTLISFSYLGIILWISIINKASKRIFIAAAFISLIFTILSLGMHGGARYYFIPSVLTALILISNLDQDKFRRMCVLGLFLVALKIPDFFDTQVFYNPLWSTFNSETTKSKISRDNIKIFPQWRSTDWHIKPNSLW